MKPNNFWIMKNKCALCFFSTMKSPWSLLPLSAIIQKGITGSKKFHFPQCFDTEEIIILQYLYCSTQ